MTWRPPRLYAILDVERVADAGLRPEGLLDVWLAAGVRLVQLRAKTLTFGPMLALADRLGQAARAAGATFIVNDRADVAALSGADGVHLGQDDLAPAEARRLLAPDRLVGLSTHTSAQVEAACADAAVSYLAFGPVFETSSKRHPDPVVGPAGLRQAAARATAAGKPLVAIGGITAGQAGEVLQAGAASVAVISDLLAGDPGEQIRRWIDATGE